MSTSWKWPGSRWWGVDFHAHTPKSYDHKPESAREHPDYRKNGGPYVLSWNQKGDLHPIAHLSGTKRTPQEGSISERFPVRIYSQKQLFALARDPNALRVVIDDSRTVRRNELNRVLEDQRNRYLSLCAEGREACNRAGALPGRRAELDDVVNKLRFSRKADTPKRSRSVGYDFSSSLNKASLVRASTRTWWKGRRSLGGRSGIWRKRMLTHNPNIVVHGDAEMVLSPEVGSGQSRIACQGGLQERAVRDEICRVMEGGREAFESRYLRIMSPESHGP